MLIAICAGAPALAADWLDARKLSADQVRDLCRQASGVQTLARMQMVAAGDAQWRRAVRRKLVVEEFAMGTPPLDPTKCYVIAHAGSEADGSGRQHRAFEVRDFVNSPAKTTVLVLGWHSPLSDRGAPTTPLSLPETMSGHSDDEVRPAAAQP